MSLTKYDIITSRAGTFSKNEVLYYLKKAFANFWRGTFVDRFASGVVQSIREWGAGVIDISSISCNWFATRALQPSVQFFDSPNASRFILFIYRIASLPYYYLFDHFQSFTSLPSNMSLQDLLLHYSCPPLVYTSPAHLVRSPSADQA